MAFYVYYDDHANDFSSTPCQSWDQSMVPLPFQASFPTSSWCEFRDESKVSEYSYYVTPSVSDYSVYTPESFQHSHVENHHIDDRYCGCYVNPSEVNYSAYPCTEPKLLLYNQPLSSVTKSTISPPESTREFNAPEFKDYSPNPYIGGYDPITTYGRPLSPSDEICYPRSAARSDVVSLDGFDYGSTPIPSGKDDLDNLPTKLPIIREETAEEKTDLETDVLENGGEVTVTDVGGEIGEPAQSIPSDGSPNKHDDDDDDDDGFENPRSGDYGYEIEMQTPYGAGLEAIDLCEGLFGYWPCLSKIEQQQQQRDKFRQIRDHESGSDPWQFAADYLFGRPMTYNYEKSS